MNDKNLNDKQSIDNDFQEMLQEYNKETVRLNLEQKEIKKKEDAEFLELVYKTGVPVYYNNRITILDKKTNKIIDISGIHHR